MRGKRSSSYDWAPAASSHAEPEGECKDGLDVGIDCDATSYINFMDVVEHALHSVDAQVNG